MELFNIYSSPDEFYELIKQSYSNEEALQHKEYQVTQDDSKTITDIGRHILREFPMLPNCCVPMSALWAAVVRDHTSIPTQLVAGNLYLQGRCVFGDHKTDNTIDPFSSSNSNWDGHCWVSFGNIIGEISFFRTAYAVDTPNWLKEIVLKSFGEGKGLILGEPLFLHDNFGLKYQPTGIATDVQITGLLKGAIQIMQRAGKDLKGIGIS